METEITAEKAMTDTAPAPLQRLKSLDALRGFDMLWIVGGEVVIFALAKYYYPHLNLLAEQMRHVAWEGFRFYDLIFALFVFIAGVSMAFSMEKHRRSGDSDLKLFGHLTKRMIVLVLLGLIYNGMLDFKFATLRYCSVLGLIGITTYVAALVAMKFKSMKSLLIAAGIVWLTVFLIQQYLVMDGFGDSFAHGKTINSWFNRLIFGERAINDPEGPLCIFSAIFLPLIGCAAGRLLILRNAYSQRWWNVAIIAGTGVIFLGIAYLLGFRNSVEINGIAKPFYPVIKKIWTGSFNLQTAGIALLLFAAFHAVIDLLKFEKWSFAFQVVGVNAILVYLGYRFFDFTKPAKMIFGGLGELTGDFKPIVIALGVVLIEWLILWVCYRKKLFFKV